MGLSLYEQETIINMSREENEMDVYTADPALMRRLSSLPAYTKTGEQKNGGKVVAMTFKADKKLLFLRGKFLKVELTDEEKAKRAARIQSVALSKTSSAVAEPTR